MTLWRALVVVVSWLHAHEEVYNHGVSLKDLCHITVMKRRETGVMLSNCTLESERGYANLFVTL